MTLPTAGAAPGAIVGPSRAAPGVRLADRSRGRFRFPLGQELERDATTPGPRRDSRSSRHWLRSQYEIHQIEYRRPDRPG
jgi:hypothetical protein